jgi:hypothetical protein
VPARNSSKGVLRLTVVSVSFGADFGVIVLVAFGMSLRGLWDHPFRGINADGGGLFLRLYEQGQGSDHQRRATKQVLAAANYNQATRNQGTDSRTCCLNIYVTR